MRELNSIEYYRKREHQERALAEAATSAAIAEIHNQMADRYAELTDPISPACRLSVVRSA